MTNVIVSNREWNRKLVEEIEARTGTRAVYISDRTELTRERLEQYHPRYVFFPHWSYLIPPSIYENFECIVFHMTDLPFGRGGSPLQNLIARGIYETKVSALRCTKELDAGEIYMKADLSLYGSAEEIYLRAAELVKEMIVRFIKCEPKSYPQEGEAVVFKRRKPQEGNVGKLQSLNQVFDYIRMLDADGYPRAFLETDYLRLELERAVLRDGYIKADVKITLRSQEMETP